jgi:ribonuclease E
VTAEPAAMPIPAPVVAAPAPVAATAAQPVAAPAAPFVLPLDSLQAVAESAGLQWVNSDTDKIRAVQAAMASEPAPVHVPRERKAVAAANEGPLVLVETRKDLSQVKLPFETTQGGSQPQA